MYLWDEPLRGHGHVRHCIGDLAERLTVQRFGGRRYKTDSTCDYCPDVVVGSLYLESKAVGRSRTAFVYGGRLEKDRMFAEDNTLFYVIWHHGADTKKVETVQQLERLVLDTMKCLYVVPFAEIDALCSKMTPDKLNSKYGGSADRPEYGSGYRIHLSLLAHCMV